jgi:hypothetical protein
MNGTHAANNPQERASCAGGPVVFSWCRHWQ